MKILAVDQSYTSCGIVVLNDEKMVYCEKLTTDKTKDMFDRAWEVAEHLRAIALNCKPDKVALEGLAFAGAGNATRDLAGLQYVIVTTLRKLDGWNVEIVTPTEVKRTATGKGCAGKDELVDALPGEIRSEFDALGVKKTTGLQDLSDAYWIGRTALDNK